MSTEIIHNLSSIFIQCSRFIYFTIPFQYSSVGYNTFPFTDSPVYLPHTSRFHYFYFFSGCSIKTCTEPRSIFQSDPIVRIRFFINSVNRYLRRLTTLCIHRYPSRETPHPHPIGIILLYIPKISGRIVQKLIFFLDVVLTGHGCQHHQCNSYFLIYSSHNHYCFIHLPDRIL